MTALRDDADPLTVGAEADSLASVDLATKILHVVLGMICGDRHTNEIGITRPFYERFTMQMQRWSSKIVGVIS